MTGAWDDPAVRAAVRTAAALRLHHPVEEDRPPSHWCHLETAGLTASGSWRAACECGWTGSWRTTWQTAAQQAVDDGLDHQKAARA